MSVAFVQGTGVQSVGSVASVSKAFASNVGSGNLIWVGAVSSADTLGTTVMSDGLSNSYTRAVQVNGVSAGRGESASYYAKNITGGACTVTLTPTSSDFVSIAIAEFSGCDTTSPLDGTPGTQNSGTNAPTTSTWTSTANGVIVGVTEQNESSTTITEADTLIYENENVTNAMPLNAEYRLDNSPGAGKSCSWTYGASRSSTSNGMSFKVASSTFPGGDDDPLIPVVRLNW